MKIKIISVGKIKEKYYTDAINEYLKRLSKYCKVEIIEVKDEMTKENASDKENDIVKAKEAERIISNLSGSSVKIALAIEGNELDSLQLADKIEKYRIDGCSEIEFIIGGSLGLHNSVLNVSDYKLSFSKMTFPHQLMRVVLLEQIYRSFRIINNEPYHK